MYSVDSDHLARPRKVLDATLTTQWDALNRAFDRSVRTNTLAGGLNIGFPGQYQDAESGLWQNWHRTYDAGIGRYTQSDPIGLAAGSFTTYGYVGGDPVGYVDPVGLCPVCVLPLIGGVTALDLGATAAIIVGGAALIDQMFSNSNRPPPGMFSRGERG